MLAVKQISRKTQFWWALEYHANALSSNEMQNHHYITEYRESSRGSGFQATMFSYNYNQFCIMIMTDNNNFMKKWGLFDIYQIQAHLISVLYL